MPGGALMSGGAPVRCATRAARLPRRARTLLLVGLAGALVFEVAYALAGADLIEAQLGDQAAFAISTGATGYYQYDCPNGCDDGNACTTDACNNGSCGHSAINCDDSNACTEDSCGANGCVNEPIDCDDGDDCNGIESCDPATGCVDGTPVECDDQNPCTEDECDPDTGLCEYPPTHDGQCCEDDGNDCTRDICEGGACTHPEKEEPDEVPSVSVSISRSFGKSESFLGLIDIGVATEASFSGSLGSAEGPCSIEGEVSAEGRLKANFVGQGFSVDAEGSGGYSCAAPVICTEGCDNEKECDDSQECCTASGSVQATLSRSFTKRIGWRNIGSLYFKASLGAGAGVSAEKTWPACAHDHLIVSGGPIVTGTLEGGVEVCTKLVQWICGCSQGRDKWTGQYQTKCSDCSRCTPYVGASANGTLQVGATYHHPEGGLQFFVSGQACLNIGGFSIGPVELEGYSGCVSWREPPQ